MNLRLDWEDDEWIDAVCRVAGVIDHTIKPNINARRKRYETADNRRDQRTAIQHFCKIMKMAHKEMPHLYCYDYKTYSEGKLKYCVEVKRRHFGIGRYSHIWLSKRKVDDARREADMLDVPLGFLVWLEDGLFFSILSEDQYEKEIGGRTDRSDPLDMERCYCVPSIGFTRIE